MCGGGTGGRSCVGHQILLCRCCDRPCRRRRRAGGGGQRRCPGRRGTYSVLLLCGLPAGRACEQGLAV